MRGCLADVMALGYWMILGWVAYSVVKNAVMLIVDGRRMKRLDRMYRDEMGG